VLVVFIRDTFPYKKSFKLQLIDDWVS